MVDKRIGHYEVVGLIGRGGMGEVYRARDTRLDRDVALKLLPPELVRDEERLSRMRREAKVLASLQHQNIAAIYGIEETDDSPVLVMELAEGDDLSERMAAGALNSEEAEHIARQLARGLEAAHEHGIVHRDLKPANIKVAPDGTVKILDFGLARAFNADPASGIREPASDMRTLTQALTGTGAVLGTTAYMSPEQARGYEVDRRSDIWAFGVILYEMLTGARLFSGQTTSDVLAAVLRHEPDWEALSQDVPAHLVQICNRCLVKDPRQRLRDIGEVRIALDGGSHSFVGRLAEPSAPAATTTGRSSRPAWITAAALGAALIAATVLGLRGDIGPRPEPPALVRASVAAPAHVGLFLAPTSPGPVKVSPDGTMFAFSGQDSTGRVLLYIRRLDEPQARPIDNTDNASYPLWSPDSRSVAFGNGGELRRVEVAGGPIVTVCKAENFKGGSWSTADEIVLAPTHNSPIVRVSANGGVPEAVTAFDEEKHDRSHRFPVWLPDARHFLYLAVVSAAGVVTDENSELRLMDTVTGTDRVLMVSQTNADYVDGQLLFVHGDILMARPFSLEALEFTGPAVPLINEIMRIQGAHLGVYSASASGTLVYASSGRIFNQAALQWLDLDGERQDLDVDAQLTLGFDVSPDGQHVAMSVIDANIGTADLWLYEVDRNLRTRFTFATEVEAAPIWSPDGLWIAYGNDGDRRSQVYRQLVSGLGAPERITDFAGDVTPSSWSEDGRYIACSAVDSTGDVGILMLDLVDGTSDLFRNTEFAEGQPVFSPNGRWLAYTSDETGTPQIFVESVTTGGGRWRVSTDEGHSPLWSPDGDRIHYLTLNGRVLSTVVNETGDALRFGETRQIDEGVAADYYRNFSVNRATGQLLVARPAPQDENNLMKLVTRWQRLLER